uniref:Uncharacterized protein n=1 Tax=Desertifilum tharense IPPAS B-1220 TaxID=1781255 RepID=A0ACD5GPH6_9CYAN
MQATELCTWYSFSFSEHRHWMCKLRNSELCTLSPTSPPSSHSALSTLHSALTSPHPLLTQHSALYTQHSLPPPSSHSALSTLHSALTSPTLFSLSTQHFTLSTHFPLPLSRLLNHNR